MTNVGVWDHEGNTGKVGRKVGDLRRLENEVMAKDLWILKSD